jgi:2-polyprenyl-3-methyl-5-hydroxy-6-metoxy-1,4-benzoquinol methylase
MNAHGETAFSQLQYDNAYPPGIECSFWHIARNYTILSWLKKSGMDREPLLEIGCGRGIIVNYLRQNGVECIGCDTATEIVIPANLARYVFPAMDFRNLPLVERRKVKGALLCDVIEHLSSPRELLRDTVGALPSLSRILLTVPARMELWSEWDDHFGHYRRYNINELDEDLKGADLELISARYFFHALYPIMLIKKGTRKTNVNPPKMTLLHRIIGNAFKVEMRLTPPRVPGTSIIAIAKARGR